jgi:hypothetical protein
MPSQVNIGVDALGNPVRFILTAGQVHDICQPGLAGRRRAGLMLRIAQVGPTSPVTTARPRR